MESILFRIPGREKELRRGVFTEVSSNLPDNCFVIYSFDKSQAFWLDESAVEEDHIENSFTPRCYDQSTYHQLAEKFKEEIITRGLSKAIFSRVMSVNVNVTSDELFDLLCETYPDAFVYRLSSKQLGTWIGATPEQLLTVSDGIGTTVSLAGTKPSGDKTPWGQKEQDEQQYVTNFIAARLEDFGVDELIVHDRNEMVAGPVKHLQTKFEFKLESGHLDLAKLLHPTPAVSGLPQEKAVELIGEMEVHDRGFYTGFLGIVGNETWLYVNLRCAQVVDDQMYLYLGGGFTKDSDVQSEWVETEHKAKTLLNVLTK